MFIRKLLSWTKFAVVAGVVTVVSVAATSASACDPPCQYKPVINYVTQQEPYQVCVVKYDHCGQPYNAYVTLYRTIYVPVTTWVKVCNF